MIRPLTIATCLLACGSGLYLYQSKHEVKMLDLKIEKTVHDTNALREQSRLLAAEWTMLNDPQRLQQFSDTYLTLKSIAPTQFTSLADLDSRLPPPEPAAPPQGTGEAAPVVADSAPADAADPAGDAADPAANAAVVADDELPVPPIPASAPVVAVVARSADIRAVERTSVYRSAVVDTKARSVAITDARPTEPRSYEQHPNEQRAYEQRPNEQRAYEQRPGEQRVAPRVVEARADVRAPLVPSSRPIVLGAPRRSPVYAPINPPPRPDRQPMVAESMPYSGSLLGMARGSMPPAPRPTPMNAAY